MLSGILCSKMAQTTYNGLSQCGKDYGICNRNLNFDSLYCHENAQGGTCGSGDNYRNFPGSKYDWRYCPGIII